MLNLWSSIWVCVGVTYGSETLGWSRCNTCGVFMDICYHTNPYIVSFDTNPFQCWRWVRIKDCFRNSLLGLHSFRRFPINTIKQHCHVLPCLRRAKWQEPKCPTSNIHSRAKWFLAAALFLRPTHSEVASIASHLAKIFADDFQELPGDAAPRSRTPAKRIRHKQKGLGGSHFKLLSLLWLTVLTCWMPYTVYWTIAEWTNYMNETVFDVMTIFYYMDPLLNPIYYVLTSQQWRAAFKKSLRFGPWHDQRFDKCVFVRFFETISRYICEPLIRYVLLLLKANQPIIATRFKNLDTTSHRKPVV